MKRYIIFTGPLILLLAISVLALSAQPGGGIDVNGADLYEINSLSGSATLIGYLNAIADRIASEYSDAIRHVALDDIPVELANQLNAVADRIRLTYGDDARHLPLTVVPPVLQTQVNNIAERLVFQYPDRNRRTVLSYPVQIIGDNIAPIITVSPQASFNGNAAHITWTTDEFTTYVLQYGTSSGSYPDQVSGSLFYQHHQIMVTGLTADVYYYRIVSTDLSGNTSTSSEYVLEREELLFLPFVVR